MSETNEFNPVTHVPVKKSHIGLAVVMMLLLIGVVGVVAYYAGGDITFVNGKAVVKVPSFDAVKGLVILKNPEGKTIETKVEEPAAPAEGTTTTDVATPNSKLHRIVEVVSSPIDDLMAAVKKTHEDVGATSESVKALTGEVKGLGDNVKDLTGSVTKIDGRVAQLEKKQEAPAQAASAPEKAPVNVAPQSSLPPSSQVASDIVTPRDANPAQMRMMLQAYGDLGKSPKKISGFQKLAKGQGFRCPDGTAGRPVRTVNDGHGIATRWKCD